MVTYVQNKLIKVTIIVDISILGFNAHCMRPQSRLNFFFFFFFFFYGWTVRRLCVTGTSLGQRSTTNLECVLYLCLTLDWRWSDVLLASTFTRRKTLTFLSMQKMCAEVDAHKK